MDIEQAFLFSLRNVCAELWTFQGQSLAALVSTGQFQGGLAWKLFHEYRTWGLLHLLVLSGSQYYSFARWWLFLSQGVQKISTGQSSPVISRLLLVPATLLYLTALGNPPPLIRCALFGVAHQFLHPLGWRNIWIIGAVFIAHVGIEGGALSDSAFLSWTAFFTLQLVNVVTTHRLLRAFLITSFLHLFIVYFKGNVMSLSGWIIAALSNLICLPLFERVLFPCVGAISAACLLLSPLLFFGLNPQIFKDFLAPAFAFILDLALLPVLVANSAFRYTFSE